MCNRRSLTTILVLALAIGASHVGAAGPPDCFHCHFVNIAPPGEPPDLRSTCFAWGDDVGWSQCQEFNGTCLLLLDCYLFG